jgi:hypothetical protein
VILGGLILVAANVGSLIAKLVPGFPSVITKDSSKEGLPPRITLSLGILIQIPFYFWLYYATDEFSAPNLDPTSFESDQIMVAMSLLASVCLLGYGQTAVEYAAKKYAFQCSWKVKKSLVFLRRLDNAVPLAGGFGLGLSGWYFWGQFLNVESLVRNYGYI